VTDQHGTPNLEIPAARVGVTADTEHLDVAVEAVCRNVIEHDFDPDEAGSTTLSKGVEESRRGVGFPSYRSASVAPYTCPPLKPTAYVLLTKSPTLTSGALC
jgi:hypothetical protein